MVAHNSVLSALCLKQKLYKFKHGSEHKLKDLTLIDSYHCSRYNTNTGRLNENRLSGVYTIDVTGVATQSLNLNLSDLRQTTQAPSNAPLGTRGQWKKNADNSLFDGGSDHTVYGSRRGTADGTTFDGYAITEIALTDNNNQWIRGHGGNFVGSIAITKAGNGYLSLIHI